MNPLLLTVYKSPFPKIRIGKEYDGGYIIADIPDPKYSLLLSGGVEYDISFEEQFLDKYNDIKCYAFDGTIEKMPDTNKNIEFIRKNIGFENTEKITNLHDIIDSNNNIFCKMDIEGGEIPWIFSLSVEQMNKFSQIVMEFHNPFTFKEHEVFKKLNNTHILVHFHPNNCCGVRNHMGIIIPNIFECTYVNKKYFTSTPELNNENIPNDIDMRNVQNNDDIFINYPPFVFKK